MGIRVQEKNFKGVGNSIGEKLKYYSLLSKSGIKGVHKKDLNDLLLTHLEMSLNRFKRNRVTIKTKDNNDAFF
ncbi:MAG: hypothetical protein WKG06_01030 [Segetibacter sp.]